VSKVIKTTFGLPTADREPALTDTGANAPLIVEKAKPESSTAIEARSVTAHILRGERPPARKDRRARRRIR